MRLNQKDAHVSVEAKERNSNLEMLRIVSMIFIIAHHYAVHGGALAIDFGQNKIIAQFLCIGGKVGVNCFILITGYFLVDSKFKFKKLLKIVGEVLFYSLTRACK